MTARALSSVMAVLVTAIHVFFRRSSKGVDHRDEPGDDEDWAPWNR
jgi:hypothetical protein